MLAAVHIEFQKQHRRKCNVVVTGLKPIDGIDDADLFTHVYDDRLPVKPAVDKTRCRRLGKLQAGKVQPLLIALNSENNVTELVQCAKLLRFPESAGIYINRDLTPAEAQATCEQRQRRRAKQAGERTT